MTANVIEIVVKVSDRSDAGFAAANRKADETKKRFGQVAAAAGGMLAGAAIAKGVASFTGFMSQSVTAASDLGESINAVNQIFGKSAPTILDWGKKNATAFGLSQRAFNEMATPLGAMLKNSGLSMQDTTKWTIDLTKRASDMASVFNTTVPEALEAIQAGLRGESDPLEKFGVGLSAAKVEAQAMAETGKKSSKALTDQEKATARLNLIMKQTETSAGDFASTSDQLANAQRIQSARTEELQAQIGTKLIPAKLMLVRMNARLAEIIAEKVVPAVERFTKWAQDNPGKIKAVAAVIGTVLVAAFYAWAAAATKAAIATIAATWPVLAVVAAIAALAAGVIYAYKHWEWFRTATDKVKEGLGYLVTEGFLPMVAMIMNVFGQIIHGAAVAFGWIPGIGDKLKGADKAFGDFKDKVNGTLAKVKKEIRIAAFADTKDALYALGRLVDRIAWVNGQRVSIKVDAGAANVRESRGISRAMGGIIGSAAGGGPRSGATLVGEDGPEIVDLAPGSHVRSNPDTQRILGLGGKIGKSLGAGFRRALDGSANDVAKAMDHLLGLVKKAGDRGAVTVVESIRAKMAVVAKKRDALTGPLLEQIRDFRKAYTDEVAQVTESAVGGASIGGSNGSFGNMTSRLSTQLDQTRKLAAAIAKLRKMGLSNVSVQQLIDAGPEAGLQAAESILGRGSAGVTQLNQLQSGLAAAGRGLGTQGAESAYGRSIATTQARVDKLDAGLDRSMDRLADALTKALKKRIRGMATGGIAGGGGTLVGEHGPEIVDLPTGARVHPSTATRRMMGAGGSGQPMVVNLQLDGRTLASLLIDPLRREVASIGGGNVQAALGRA